MIVPRNFIDFKYVQLFLIIKMEWQLHVLYILELKWEVLIFLLKPYFQRLEINFIWEELIFCTLIWHLSHFGYFNKIPQTGWYKQQTSISHSSGGWKSLITVHSLGHSIVSFCWGLFSGSQIAAFLLYLHTGLRESSSVFSFYYTGTHSTSRVSLLCPYLNQFTSQRPLCKYHHIKGYRFNI